MEYTEKQQHIIDVAQKLFAGCGFDGTSIRDIAKEATVNVAMISYYFGSKEKLLEAVFEKHSAGIRIKLETLLNDTTKTPIQKVDFLIDSYIDKHLSQQDFHKIVAREQLVSEGGKLADMIQDMKKRNQLLIKQILGEGQKTGVFKKHIDIPMMMATLIGTSNQFINTLHFYREINGLQDMPEEEFRKHIRKKLSTHLKTMFKATIINEK